MTDSNNDDMGAFLDATKKAPKRRRKRDADGNLIEPPEYETADDDGNFKTATPSTPIMGGS